MSEQPKVIVRCLVYNHEHYLRDCLEGFVMQKTNFPFKAVVHDDASTDDSATIVREYAEKYPDIIEPIYETENQYCKQDGSLNRIMDAATLGRSPYLAYCEGDDYWTDPHKLQKQVDYMDTHPECSMTCTHAEILTPNGVLDDNTLSKTGWIRPLKTGILKTEDIIEKGGKNIYIHTCTMLLRSSIIPELRRTIKSCSVGDYPLQIMSTLKGCVYYLHEKTACYRYGFGKSWTGQLESNIKGGNISLNIKQSIMQMLTCMNKYSQSKYNTIFKQTQAQIALQNLHNFPTERKNILKRLGWALKYSYIAEAVKAPQNSIITRIQFIIMRTLAWPYYPFLNTIKYMFSPWHPAVIMARFIGKWNSIFQK